MQRVFYYVGEDENPSIVIELCDHLNPFISNFIFELQTETNEYERTHMTLLHKKHQFIASRDEKCLMTTVSTDDSVMDGDNDNNEEPTIMETEAAEDQEIAAAQEESLANAELEDESFMNDADAQISVGEIMSDDPNIEEQSQVQFENQDNKAETDDVSNPLQEEINLLDDVQI
eukprot:TRINITY_DN636_c0_g1_i5.p2 TRINITY_DN636_c0_g1~~TRINITY_DN636_c0_g1_i5.p2  ORF type:complete len:174 (-),score=44.86 TRINITY_DN636_c0_g1_i5:324-845(-)